MVVLQAAREVVEETGFDEVLDSVRERVDEIESLHRTRELTVRATFESQTLFLMNLPFSSRMCPQEIGYV